MIIVARQTPKIHPVYLDKKSFQTEVLLILLHHAVCSLVG